MAKRGRKKLDPPVIRKCVNITEAQVKLLRMWGRGDVSAGLRWLIDAAAPLVVRVDVSASTPRRLPLTPSP